MIHRSLCPVFPRITRARRGQSTVEYMLVIAVLVWVRLARGRFWWDSWYLHRQC